MTDDKELKDQRIPIMMTPSEVTALDDWMFERRLRSRGEAIRRLCTIGISADEQFYALVDSYLAVSRAAMDVAARTDSEAEAMEVLKHVADAGQAFGKLRGAILAMRQDSTIDAAFAELDEIRAAYAAQDPERALDLMRAVARHRKKPD